MFYEDAVEGAVVHYQVLRSDQHGNEYDDIAGDLSKMRVNINQDAQTSPWTFSGESRNPAIFQRFVDYVIPKLRFVYGDGLDTGWMRLGHYRIRSTPRRHPTSGTMSSFTAEDLTAVISRRQISAPLTVAAGTNVQTWLTTALTSSLGFAAGQVAIPEITKSLSLAATYESGTSWITIINSTLESVGMRHLYMTAAGLLTTSPSIELTSISPVITYTDATVIGTPTEDPDDSRIKNVQTVRRITPGAPPIEETYRNEDASSPLYVNGPVGELAGVVIDDPQIADSATALQRAKTEVSFGSSFYNKVTLNVVPRLDIDLYQVVALDLRDIANNVQLSGNWYQRTIDFPLGPPVEDMRAGCVLQLNRVQPFILEGGA